MRSPEMIKEMCKSSIKEEETNENEKEKDK
jgi:hypothetical protein